MGKSAKCIQMLQLLKSRGLMSREELAEELQTNKRNLVEYRREIEDAGYRIESVTGRYGGYRLLEDVLLPVLKLTQDEQKALLEAQKYQQVQSDFLAQKEFMQAMDKIRMQMRRRESDNIYIRENEQVLHEDIRKWIRLCEDAIQQCTVLELTYRGMKDTAPKRIQIHPYEILHHQGAYYCLAYSLSAKDFRNYKFSRERMKKLTVSSQKFNRDKDFDVKDHVGTLGLMKDDLHEFEVLIRGSEALLVAERRPGIHPQLYWKDDQTLYLKTIMEGKMNVHAFLLSLGSSVEVLSPRYLQKEYRHIVSEMYEKNRT